MKVKPNDYLKYKDKIIQKYNSDGLDGVTFFCAVIGVPCIAAYKFIHDETGNEELLKRIQSLKEFYNVEIEES